MAKSGMLPANDERLILQAGNGSSVSAVWSGPEAGPVFVYAPGAGAGLGDAFGLVLAEALPAAGIACLRFEFPYREAGRSRPDPPSVLESTWRSVIDFARGRTGRIAVGGRSMGGRIASQVVAQGVVVDGLALFAFPLRPPGRPDNVRDGHLPRIGVPTLFCSGTRDTFGTVAELEAAAALVPDARLHVLDGADHGFNVLKASGRSRTDVHRQAVEALLAFLRSLGWPAGL